MRKALREKKEQMIAKFIYSLKLIKISKLKKKVGVNAK